MVPLDPKYDVLSKDRGLILITDKNDVPIDFVLYDPSAPDFRELAKVEVGVDKEIGCYIIGDRVDDMLDSDRKYIKSFDGTPGFEFANVASFDIHQGKIISFSGNGFGSGTLDSNHLDFVLQNLGNPDFQHALEVTMHYLIYSNETDAAMELFICAHNEKTNEMKLYKEVYPYGLNGSSRISIDWGDADQESKKWREEFLAEKPADPTSEK